MKKKASGSSFYMAMRLMPEDERDAMFAIYAFCRKVDDIADDGLGTRAERHAQAGSSGATICARSMPARRRARVRFLAPAVAQYGLRLEDFLTILDGMEMDVAEDIVAPDLATLDLYCDRVASAVGRLSIKVFGMEEGPGFDLAHHLGRALQLTNILRDIDEDAAIGRLYLPREYLEEMDCCRQLDPKTVHQPARDRCGLPQGRGRWRIIIMTRPPRILARQAQRPDQDAAADGRGLFRDLARQRGAGFCAAAPPRVAAQGQAAVAGAAARAVFVMTRPQGLCHRRGPCRPVRRHRSWRRAAWRSPCSKARRQAGGRCRSYYDPAMDGVIDNGNHLVLSGNQRCMPIWRALARATHMQGRRRADLRLSIPKRRALEAHAQ